MKRNRKRKLKLFFRKLIYFINKPAGGKGNMPHSHIKALLGGHYCKKIHYIVEIIKGLANAHKHNGGDFFAVFLGVLCRKINLGKHLRRGQVAAKPRKSGGAEGAAHSAAALGGNTKASASLICHTNSLNMLAVAKAEKIFYRSVKF